jgi:SAM-dependent methyltransferase
MSRSSSAQPAKAHATTLSVFQQGWRIYRTMVDENYLFHREAYACLHDALINLRRDPFLFLDIGCGDASGSAQAFRGTPILGYHGIDLSPDALALAKKTLAGLPCPVTLEQGDFAEVLDRHTEPADVVWSSLALHHLRSDGKEEVMRTIRRLLTSDGLFLLYENTSPDGEDREKWLARWDRQRPGWSAYTDEDWTTMTFHVHSADFPETCSGWRQLGKAAGFSHVQELFVAPTNLFRVFAFQ